MTLSMLYLFRCIYIYINNTKISLLFYFQNERLLRELVVQRRWLAEQIAETSKRLEEMRHPWLLNMS